MPPKRAQTSRNTASKEGRILLAIKAIQNQSASSIRAAAAIYDVPWTTLRDRLNGTANRENIRANSHKLTQNKEDSLV